MGVELSKHKNIIPHIERMLQRVHEHQLTCGANACASSVLYRQKIEALRTLQQQIAETATRLHTLRVSLHTESDKAYRQLKADDRIIRKCVQRG